MPRICSMAGENKDVKKLKSELQVYKICCIALLIVLLIVLVLMTAFMVFAVFPSMDRTLQSMKEQTNFETKEVQKEELKTINLFIDSLPSGVDSNYLNTLREARTFWEQKENVFFKEVKTASEADVRIMWVKEFGTRTLGHLIHENFMEIGLGDSSCFGKWQAYKYEDVKNIAIHELGHVLGYPDDYSNTNSVMYYQIGTSYETDIDESGVLADGYFRFLPFCTKQSVASYTLDITSNVELDIRVVPTRENYELYANNKEYLHYTSCSKDEITNYHQTCTVASGGGIVIRNPSVFNMGDAANYRLVIKEN